MTVEKKKSTTIMKLFTGIMLALVFALGIPGFMLNGTNAAEKKPATPTKKEVRALVKKIVKANNVDHIRKKHKTFCRLNDDSITWFNKTEAYTRSYMWNYATYTDENGSYTLKWDDGEFSYGFIVGDNIDRYDITHARDYMDNCFSKYSLLEDKTVSIEYKDGNIIITRLLNKNSTRDFLEGWGITGVTGNIYDVGIYDEKTYEIKVTYVYEEGHEDKPLNGATYFFYDIEEPAECTLLRGMAYRAENITYSFTVIRDAGTENEISIRKYIPAGAAVKIYAPGIEYARYADPECTEPYEKWDGLSDTIVYIRTDPNAA